MFRSSVEGQVSVGWGFLCRAGVEQAGGVLLGGLQRSALDLRRVHSDKGGCAGGVQNAPTSRRILYWVPSDVFLRLCMECSCDVQTVLCCAYASACLVGYVQVVWRLCAWQVYV